ncbi:peroxisomal membrane protein 4 [Thelephora ganbajun]|uniref:Peroxisomal membrane protein 4 n=1 Tax=Thelephora ganbajun TaxID=370292 RepID=A0ACB6ZD77_THEGA|nr:peroxisomal membrane protein 4 [Thelephora ganbajun]
MATIQHIISDPAYHDYLGILKGARNGFVYGVKIRFPHALIMAILFGRGDWNTRARTIFQATKTHATNLMKYVALYKSLVLIQKKANGGKERTFDTFFAGLVGGYLVFGDRNAINEQVVLYICSRVIASFIPRATPKPQSPTVGVKPIPPDSRYFSIFAALVWGSVMWLYEHKGETIQPGMFNSMTYLYRDSNVWTDLRTLLWHNR